MFTTIVSCSIPPSEGRESCADVVSRFDDSGSDWDSSGSVIVVKTMRYFIVSKKREINEREYRFVQFLFTKATLFRR
jgi:hypothetical protein